MNATIENIQATVERLVKNEVIHNASALISTLSTSLSEDSEYYDDTHSLCCPIFNEDGEEYESEPLEHWIVSDWLAIKLDEQGEVIVTDFMGFNIWGRTCSGQSITLDGVFNDIAVKLNA